MQGEKPRNPEKIKKKVNENAEGRTGSWWRSECKLAGRNKAGNEGDVRAIRTRMGAGKTIFCPFDSEPRAGLGGVCAQRETQDLLVVSY
jgi:hypothetical protein